MMCSSASVEITCYAAVDLDRIDAALCSKTDVGTRDVINRSGELINSGRRPRSSTPMLFLLNMKKNSGRIIDMSPMRSSAAYP